MLRDQIHTIVQDAVGKAYPDLDTSLVNVTVEIPQHKTHGDFATNIAMHLAKPLKQKPLEIAEHIIGNMDHGTIIEEVSIAGPGFINIRLTSSYLLEVLKHYELPTFERKEDTIIVEYSSPNIAKEMHIGHLMTTLYGEALTRLLRHTGHHVIADNHLGDYGTQFGKLVYAIKTWGDMKVIEKDPIPELEKLYREFHVKAEEDESLVERGREESKKIEDGDEENVKLWKWVCEISLQEFNKIYEELDVHMDTNLGESFYAPMMEKYVQELLDTNIATKNEDGSIGVVFEDHGMDIASCPIMRSDGGSLYITRDIPTIAYRLKEYKPTKMIYVVGSEQSLHFKQLFAIAQLLGWNDCHYVHMSYARLSLPEGQMSSRKGTVINAKDLINEGRNRVEEMLLGRGLGEELRDSLRDMMAIGAIKYCFYSHNRNTPITFEWDKVLSFEGNSAPYLQYTYARSRSILRRAKEEFDLEPIFDGHEATTLETEKERELILKLAEFEEIIVRAGEEQQINIMANYLYELAQLFNSFYNSSKVLGIDEGTMKIRLRMVESMGVTLKKGLELLSIEVPEVM